MYFFYDGQRVFPLETLEDLGQLTQTWGMILQANAPGDLILPTLPVAGLPQEASDPHPITPKSLEVTQQPAPSGFCSDGSALGNPGPSAYRVTDLQGRELLRRDLGEHSNNYAELAGIGAMVKLAMAEEGPQTCWTDSAVALGWLRTGRIGKQVLERTEILKMVSRIQSMLGAAPHIQLKKWDTRTLGEIPADFGNKSK